jgi:hypothetical protein
MSLNILINTLPPGGLQPPPGGTLVVPGDLSGFPLDPYGRRVITTAQTFNRLDLRQLYGRTPIYLQFLSIATPTGSGVTGFTVAQQYANAEQPVPLVLPGLTPEQAFVPNIYLDENALLSVVPQGVLTPVLAQLVLSIQPITPRDRSRLQCCYNGSPAIGPGQSLPDPVVDSILPASGTQGSPITALVSGQNFLPGDEIVLTLLGSEPMATVFVDPSTLDVTLDPNPLTAGVYTVQVRRAGILFPSTVTFTVQGV